ncbi:TetR/AcrR family transcriptional regulator [Celerinatantimonas diazotrophica]|uniref:TetR family transcriptional regulator n=1 Tax=Celerinatantimonas diazotrophica TaxID=412034 RepID=A0A4R1JAN2_9GAMM|nr:TetR family transcriptional regulator C-terminal domain-containing protein [Celerinatantimonas diazotrophica]TCK47557.1 TetR family transcriptional regulator [Celerinatantimonas diazotrophica]CAG9296823.1 HTH-type transcriptional regulator BetI [Celerinatantimonas diazotrophica]
MKEKKFQRYDADERKSSLIKSTLNCLKLDGYAGLSVRKITREANVSQGMINHHFGSIDSLVINAYDAISNEFFDQTNALIDSHKGSASEKLIIFFRSYISEDNLDPDLMKAWLVFWSLIRNSQDMASTYEYVNEKIETLLNNLLLNISKEEGLDITDTSLAAQSLIALLDGAWVRTCLSEKNLPPENTMKIFMKWLEAYKLGVFS